MYNTPSLINTVQALYPAHYEEPKWPDQLLYKSTLHVTLKLMLLKV